MPNVILAINAGSSSVKVSVYSYSRTSPATDPTELAVIQVSGLTAPPAKLTYTRGGEQVEKDKELADVSGPEAAYAAIQQTLIDDAQLTSLRSPDDIEFACHRVVHGGDHAAPQRLDDRGALAELTALSELAPLHNGGALAIVRAVQAASPGVANVAFFDSAFHAALPRAVRAYAIDPRVAARNKLRKYGFHGLSYAFIARAVGAYLSGGQEEGAAAAAANSQEEEQRKDDDDGGASIIALHLGSGASACAIARGARSVDTSMGLTPLSGLPGATRAGDVDASLIFHFTHDAGRPAPGSAADLHLTRAEDILNKHSGWAALTGTTDFGAVSARAGDGDEQCQLAVELFVDRIVGYVGAYYVKLGGDVDALVFAGGIGEKGAGLRAAVVERLACLGFALDDGKNASPADAVVADIGKAGARHRVLVCRTDEQAEMARQCAQQADSLSKQ